MIEFQDVSFSYGDREVLRKLSLTVDDGETVAILGENGSGKTTLLQLGAEILTPESGTLIRRHSGDTSPAYLPQSIDFPSRLTVSDVLRFYQPTELQSTDHSRSLEFLGVESFESQRYGWLSGGQKRRVALRIVLSRHTPLFLFDEPFAGLSPESVKALSRYLDRIDGTILFTTHLWQIPRDIADRSFRLVNGSLESVEKDAGDTA